MLTPKKTARRKCAICREWFHPRFQNERWCCPEHGAQLALQLREKERAKAEAKRKTVASKSDKAAKAELRKRKAEVNRTQHLDKLQRLVNQWVLHVRDVSEPCCTCGTTNQGIKYDAGHFISRGSSPELRFEVTNIHKQCSVNCNGFKSGARAEYIEFIIAKYGQEHYDWLRGPHPKLKDQLPDADAIEAEVLRYRKLIRDAGLKPRA